MKYYNIVNNELKLTIDGKDALNELGITLKELKDYPDEKLSVNYWTGCKTYMDQALKNGHGCTWLDDARIPHNNESLGGGSEKRDTLKGKEGWDGPWRHNKEMERAYCERIRNNVKISETKGRFPANVLCEDDVLNDGIERKTAKRSYVNPDVQYKKPMDDAKGYNTHSMSGNKQNAPRSIGDTGSYSRYFNLDAWFAERIKLLPKEAQKTFPWLIVPKASKNEKNRGLEERKSIPYADFRKNFENTTSWVSEYPNGKQRPMNDTKNNHPTCKPLKLMSWLITLASREGDTVLDPFCGSGTTAIAAKMLGRQYICIEKEEEYWEIARKRISAIPQQLDSYNML